MSVQKVTNAEEFNEVYKELNKVYNVQQRDWDLRVPTVLWAYRTTCKKLMGKTPSRLAYGANIVIPMEYIMLSPCIVAPMDMMDHGALEEGIAQLNEEECLGPDEEIQQGDLRLQEVMKEIVRLREKSAMMEEEVKKLEEGTKEDFIDNKIVVIKQDAHNYVENLGTTAEN